MDDYDKLQAWHKAIYQDYLQALKANEALYRNDSISRENEKDMWRMLGRARDSVARYTGLYDKEASKKRRPFGFMIGGNVQPNPLRVAYGVSFGWTPNFMRFGARQGSGSTAPVSDDRLKNELFRK